MSIQVLEDGIILILCTCPDDKTAKHISSTLVDERLAACVQILPQGISVFRWQDAIERVPEHVLLVKTRSAHSEAVTTRIRELHPYDVPEIVQLHGASLNPDYTQWLQTCTSV